MRDQRFDAWKLAPWLLSVVFAGGGVAVTLRFVEADLIELRSRLRDHVAAEAHVDARQDLARIDDRVRALEAERQELRQDLNEIKASQQRTARLVETLCAASSHCRARRRP